MPVLPRIFGGPAGQSAQVFTDDFTGPVGSGTIVDRPPWQILMSRDATKVLFCDVVSVANAVIQGCIDDPVLNRFLMSCVGAVGVTVQARSFITPAPFWGPLLNGLSQYAQAVISSDNSTGGANVSRGGIAVLCSQNQSFFAGYCLSLRGDTMQCALYRGIGFAGTEGNTQIIAGGGSMVFAFGDTMRVEVVRGAASNTVTVKRNGVTIGSIVDANASRPTLGWPGFVFFMQFSNAFQQTYDNFEGGPL